jgi:uncharacterized DUF497 family protein
MSERPYPEMAELEFEWDIKKDRANALKHDIRFENVRIISARRANRNEAKEYAKIFGPEGPGR